MEWYYSKNLTQLGPVPEAELRARIAAGKLTGADMAWTEGMKGWQPLAGIETFRALYSQAAVSGVAPASPYAPPVSSPAPVAEMDQLPPTSGLAIASLVCGIVGLVTPMFLPGIPAVICGHMALKRMADPSVRLGGRRLAIAGLVTGYLSILCMAPLFLMLIMWGIMGGDR